MALGHRLQQARMAEGLSLRALAGRVELSAQTLSNYERGVDVPGSEVLMRLADGLHVSLAWFFRNVEAGEMVPQYRKRKALPKKEEKRLLATILDQYERYLAVEDVLRSGEKLDEDRNLKDLCIKNLGATAAPLGADVVAEKLRVLLNLGEDPVENLTEILEDWNIKVFEIAADQHFDACTFLGANGEPLPLIVSKAGLPGDRQRFNLAHEFGHIVSVWVGQAQGHDEEFANRFAAAFLVPAAAARRELGDQRDSIDLLELHLLKHKYGLSMQAWMYRAKDLGIISRESFVEFQRMFRARGYHKKEPGDPLPVEKPTRFNRLVMRAFSESLISESKAGELLGVPFRKFMREVSRDHGLPASLHSR
jgi:Zn-dependent peptidase ImmA (M78 family)/DNA-binding XRE family transcriptional regulator